MSAESDDELVARVQHYYSLAYNIIAQPGNNFKQEEITTLVTSMILADAIRTKGIQGTP